MLSLNKDEIEKMRKAMWIIEHRQLEEKTCQKKNS